MIKPRVVYWNNIPAPYIVERFDEVARRGNLDFEAWFNERREADRSWRVDETAWQFRYRYLPRVPLFRPRLNLAWPLLTPGAPDLLVSLYAEPSFMLGWQLARLRGVRTTFWAQTTFDTWVPRKPWREALKRYVFSRVDATLGSGADSQAFAVKYGTPPEKALRLPHATDIDFFGQGSAERRKRREEVRQDWALQGTTFTYVGRMFPGKGLDHLMDAFAVLQKHVDSEVSLLLIGDGPDEARLRSQVQEEGIRNVIFAGFQHRDVLPKLYAASDVFVFPTLGDPYGLVVDEAMACNLPIISTTSAGEIRERVEDGVNGFLVPASNSAALFERMRQLAGDATLRRRMGRVSAGRISLRTVEQWARDFESVVERILTTGNRQSISVSSSSKETPA